MNISDNQEILVREASFADQSQIFMLQDRLGLRPDAIDDWERIWRNNPEFNAKIPIGWVITCNGLVVGYLGNVPLKYYFGFEPVIAAAARGWVVDQDYRQYSLLLLAKYISQKNVDILLNSSSNLPTFHIFKGLGCKVIPVDIFSKIVFWVIDSKKFTYLALKKTGDSKKLQFLKIPIRIFFSINALLNYVFINIKLKILKCTNRRVEIRRLLPSQINDDFEKLWRKKIEQSTIFIADRSKIKLNWYFNRKNDSVALLGFYKDGVLIGYAAFLSSKILKTNHSKMQLLDFLVLDDHPEFWDFIVCEGYLLAKSKNATMLEMMPISPNFSRAAQTSCALTRPHFPTPFTYKVLNRGAYLKDILGKGSSWWVTLYDGDSGL